MLKFLLPVILVFSVGIANDVVYRDYAAFRFFDFGIGARSIGMGNAVIVSIDDEYSVYWNPAKLAMINGTSFSASYLANPLSETGSPLAGFTKPQFTLAQSLKSYGTVGLGVGYLGFGDDIEYLYKYEKIYTELSPPDYSENFLYVSYGNIVISGFCLGVNIKGYRMFKRESDSYGLSADLGSYFSLTPSVSIALVYQSGTSIFHGYVLEEDTVTVDSIEVRMRIPAKTAFGIAYRPLNNLLLEIDIKTRKEGPYKLYIGGEYHFCLFSSNDDGGSLGFSIRMGARDLFGKEAFNDRNGISNHAFTAGIGIIPTLSFVRGSIDYALVYRPEVAEDVGSFSHTFSLGVNF